MLISNVWCVVLYGKCDREIRKNIEIPKDIQIFDVKIILFKISKVDLE